ncbi:glycosyltransferase [Calothrix sp. FACHB-1219]|uniref:glycosyltransferase family 2 protein n=1 Tax=unclassified Calothrix TaxID=2619626 RepID=UPI001686CCF6|nr:MULTISPECIES: glycosyltransferase [unclassified Calothrix]MBD2201594.1 glycosyltransferase [Calothrix sp. FACHB-168]MBD2217280.1 glycosyltransferase [Calothrix sp. FACHB-1219]
MSKVVVVMPLYNCEKYLGNTLRSLSQQAFYDWNCVMVDDGSTDSTREIAVRYVETDRRFNLISQENEGAASARNTAIDFTLVSFPDCKYIAFLDGDDTWHPFKLQEQVDYLDKEKEVSIVCTNYRVVDENGFILKEVKCPSVVNRVDLFLENYVATASNPLIVREAFEKIGYPYFNPNLKRCDDHECWFKILTQLGGRLEFIQQPLLYYRITPSSLQSDVEKQFKEWDTMIDIISMYSPLLVNSTYWLARAYQCKTVAIRAMRNKDWKLAIKYAIEAIKSDWKIVPRYLLDRGVKK